MASGAQTRVDRFVNPYAFVGVPDKVPRTKPHGHDVARVSRDKPQEDLWYGTVEVTWTVETPLLLPAKAETEGWIVRGEDGQCDVRIPGSSVKGAVRSLHETMFNGCLRVVDGEFVPGYRDAARQENAPALTDAWRLGVIASLDEEQQPSTVRLCDEQTVWVEATSLRRAYRAAGCPPGRLPSTSDIFDLEGGEEESSLRVNGAEMHRVQSVRDIGVLGSQKGQQDPIEAGAGRQVLLVSDTAARKRDRAERTKRGRAFWAVGTLSNDSVEITAAACEDFRRAVAGSRDREVNRRETERSSCNKLKDVAWWPDTEGPLGRFEQVKEVIAQRKEATGFLYPGDVVWVQLGPSKDDPTTQVVTKIKLSQLWRHAGEGAVKTRVPEAVLPCTHPYGRRDKDKGDRKPKPQDDGLCLSCQIFGSADTRGESAGKGQQDSYAGHVRMGSARTEQPVQLHTVRLAPMGNPHAGAGMFYLNATTPSDQRRAGDLPSQWGSAEDSGRSLRGRKFYWHGDPDAQASHWSQQNLNGGVRPRYRARPHQERNARGGESEFVRDALLIPTGTTLVQKVQINGLTKYQVATFLAALQPVRVLGQLPQVADRRLALRLGGGKPLGLGSVSTSLKAALTTAADRYTATQSTVRTAASFTATLRELHAAGHFSPRYASQLARILDLEGLGEWVNHVSYPPGADWSSFNSEDFDKSFEFFGQNSGEKLKNKPTRPYEPLPDIPLDPRVDFDPTLPVYQRLARGDRSNRQGGRPPGQGNRPWTGQRRGGRR